MSRKFVTALVVVLAVVALVEGALLLGLYRPAAGKDNETPSFELLSEPVTSSRMTSANASPAPSVSPFNAGPVRAADPFAELDRMRREMDARMQELMQRFQAGSTTSFVVSTPMGTAAVSDIALAETDDAYVCTLHVEGVDEDSIELMVEDDVLSVSGNRTMEQTQEHQGRVVAHVRHTERFTRSVALPGPVDAPCIKTSFKDGVLTINVPKARPGEAAH